MNFVYAMSKIFLLFHQLFNVLINSVSMNIQIQVALEAILYQIYMLHIKIIRNDFHQSHQPLNNRQSKSSNMIEAQKINNLAIQIAIYRYYFQRISPSISKIIQSLLQGCRLLEDESKFLDENTLTLFFDQKQWYFSPHIPRLCNQIAIQLIKKQFNKIRKESDRNNNRQLGAAQIKTLSLFLNYNYENYLILGQQSKALFQQEDLVKIFDCSFQQLKFLTQKFLKNRQKIKISRVKLIEKQLFNTFVLIKVKSSISRRLQSQVFPIESSIQESLLRITQIFKQDILKLEQKRESLSNICKQPSRFNQKKHIEGQLKELILENRAKLYELEQKNQLKNRYKESMNKLKEQLSDKKEDRKNMSAKYVLALQLFNYYKYKYHHQWAQDIYARIQKQHLFKGSRLMREFMSPDLLAQCDIDNEHYMTIVMKMVEFHYRRKQILFIDHIQFYKKEFHLYNLLSKKVVTQDKNCSLVIPNEDCLLYLFTGVTAEGLLFYNIIKDKVNTYSYYDKIKNIYKKLGEKCPKAIVIFTTDELRYHQLFKLKNLIIYLQEKGIKLYFLPVSLKNINPNKKIQLFIKYSLMKEMSQHIKNPNFKELLHARLLQKLKDQFLKKNQTGKRQFWLQTRNRIPQP